MPTACSSWCCSARRSCGPARRCSWFYIALGAIGWWQWQSGRVTDDEIVVRRAGWRVLAGCVAFVVFGTCALHVILVAVQGSVPFWDALTTCLALAAQFLLNTRRIETWFFWIAADCIYIPLYLSQGLSLTAAVYALFLVMCVLGLREWSRSRERVAV
ncbi:nicotinamide riboside transporter PnuC [Mycobacterium sp. C31M]